MTLKEFKDRINKLKNNDFVYKIAKVEVDNIYACILYYMALETNIDRGHTRVLWVKAVNKLSDVLAKEIPLMDYNIWKNYNFKNNLKESDSITVIANSNRLSVSTDDEVFNLYNLNMAKSNNLEGRDNRLVKILERREREYIGILGEGYQYFYVDKVINKVQLAVRGTGSFRLLKLSKYLKNYTKRLKNYLETGK